MQTPHTQTWVWNNETDKNHEQYVFRKKNFAVDGLNCISQTQKDSCTLTHFRLHSPVLGKIPSPDQSEGQFAVLKNVTPRKPAIKKTTKMSETLKSPRSPRLPPKTETYIQKQRSCPDLGCLMISPTTQQAKNDQFQAFISTKIETQSFTSQDSSIKGRTRITIKELLC
jgi:hypothetical protein